MRILRSALIAWLTCSACAPYSNSAGGVAIAYVDTGTLGGAAHPPISSDQVEVFSVDDALPPYEEIGYIEAFQAYLLGNNRFGTIDGMLEPLRAQAARQGCNAIVLHDACNRTFLRHPELQLGGGWTLHGARRTASFPRIGATCVWIEPTAGGQEPLAQAPMIAR